jgi:serine phosphatase RsbU (regulator of sigma subunit)
LRRWVTWVGISPTFSLPNGLVGVYMGDVVGKALIAAMYASLVMGTIRGINKTGEDTAAVLGLLNKRLCVRPVPGRYSSMSYALFNPATGELTFSNAGVPLPLLLSSDGCRSLGEGGFPSGMFPDAASKSTLCSLRRETPCCLPPTVCMKCAMR